MGTAPEVLAEFGKRVAALRVDAGFTRQHLAQAIGLARSSVANIERGHQEPGISTLIDISMALGVDVGQLLGFDPVRDPLPWHELANRINGTERRYRKLAADAFDGNDFQEAARLKSMADGLDVARTHHLHTLAEYREGRLRPPAEVP